MRKLLRITSLTVFCLMLTACDKPIIFTGGGELSGTEVDVPTTWRFEEVSSLAQLETNPDDPYSINLVYVQMNGQLYVYAGDTRTNWVHHMDKNPLVRLKVGDSIYPLSAVRVEDENELTEFAAIWAGRSMFSRDPMQFDEVWLYRLESR